MAVFLVFLGLVLLRLVFICVLLVLALSLGPRCPACGKIALRIRARWLTSWAPWLERRWCIDCGWEGITRRRDAAPVERERVGAGDTRPVH